jgi:ferritin-like metal-binding protein YciE
MTAPEQKISQYLGEARASESALVRDLQSQIAITPRGSYRTILERHLRETRDHSTRVNVRRGELGQASNPLASMIGFGESVIAQTFALAKVPLDLIRGSSGEEKVLKTAKDACAAEALEIATYTAIERLARATGDDETADLAASIREEEQEMLDQVLREIPKLTDAVAKAELKGESSYDVTKTGAADAVRRAAEATRSAADTTSAATRRTARQARKIPGVAEAEGQLKGAVASEEDLAISGYDALTAEEIATKLPELSQIDLAKIDSYERRTENRITVLNRVSSLRADEPWPGYDELTVPEVQAVLSEADDDRSQRVSSYERTHKNRVGVLDAAERVHARA